MLGQGRQAPTAEMCIRDRLWDERLTTVSAEKVLMESGVRRENRKLYIDKIAAVFILQGYLDSVGMRGV